MTWLVGRASALVGLLLCVVATAGGADLPPVSKYVAQVEPGLWLAGELDLDGLRYWDPASTVIIDLRTKDEGVADERTRVQAMGIAYYNVPIADATIVEADLQRVRRLLRERGADSVILHCATGNRAGLVWGALQLDDGEDLPAVLEAVSGVVTKDSVTQALQQRASADSARMVAEPPAGMSPDSP